jgi:hypothetical protein
MLTVMVNMLTREGLMNTERFGVAKHTKRIMLLRSFERLTANEKEFYDRFVEEMKVRDEKIKFMLGKLSEQHQRDIARHSLEQVVLLESHVDVSDSLKSLARMHGKDGMGINKEMFMKWRDAFLSIFRDFDPYASDSLTGHWASSMLEMVNLFDEYGNI